MQSTVMTGQVVPPRGPLVLFLQLVLWCAAACLVACGGGGGGGDTAPVPSVSITTQPTDLGAVEGSTAEFTVVAAGDALYQWQRLQNGAWTNLPGATTAALSVGPAQLSDHGSQFRVVVTSASNASNTVASSLVTLSVTARVEAPTLVIQPSDQAATAGQPATFSVTAAGTLLRYQWQRGADGAPWSDIAGATVASFTISAASEADNAALFRVQVSNTAGTLTSQAARLTVAPLMAAPVFTANPNAVSAVAGQVAVFSAAAIGTPSPTLSWQSSSDGAVWADLAGASGSSLTIAPVSMADNGKQYRALATNSIGTVNSAAAALSVTPQPVAPILQSQPQAAVVGTGASATFAVTATGIPSVSYQWQVSIDGGANFANINGATQATFTFTASTLGDNGKLFRVLVSNVMGTVSSAPALLTVLAPPTITLQPTAQAWRPGQTDALYTVAAVGSDLRYQWQVSSAVGGSGPYSNVPGATGASYLHAASASSQVKFVRVVVSNAIANATSDVAALGAITWHHANPRPTGDMLIGEAWVDSATVVAVSDAQTILRSTDAGLTWAIASESILTSYQLRAVAFSSNIGIAVGERGTVKRSQDGGQHWISVLGENLTRSLRGVAFSSANTATAVGDDGALLRTTDGGAHWAAPTSDGGTAHLHAVAFSADGVGLAVGDQGTVLRSVNAGANWTRVRSGGRTLATVAFATRSVVLAAGDDGTMLRSTDAGLTWQAVASATPFWIVEVNFGSPMVGAAATSQGSIVRTSDGGVSWVSASPVLGHSYGGLRFGGADTAVVVGAYGMIRRSTDGGATWNTVTAGPTSTANDVAFASQTVGVSVGDKGSISRTTDAGATWAAVSTGNTRQLQGVAFANASTGVAVGLSGAFLRTSNGGASWQAIGIGASQDLWGVAFASPTVGAIATGTGILRTTDAGVSWQPAGGVSTPVHHVAFGDALTGVAIGSGGDMIRTIDGGQTWSAVSTGNTTELLDVAFASPTTVVAVGRGVISRSTDGGVSWTTSPSDPYSNYWFYGVHFVDSTLGFAVGNFSTVLVTRDAGITWNSDVSQKAATLSAVASAGPHKIIAVGTQGVVLRNTTY